MDHLKASTELNYSRKRYKKTKKFIKKLGQNEKVVEAVKAVVPRVVQMIVSKITDEQLG